MQMTESEILRNIFGAADQRAQVQICAELNDVPVDTIKDILKKNGVDLRKLRTAVKKEHIERKPYKKPEIIPCPPPKDKEEADNGGVSLGAAFAAIIARIAELTKQKKDIEDELNEISVQLNRADDVIAGRL
ncbi:MAG: hypothetical protein IKG98_05575 [Ruminococcus sp.]|nr:hypothetical protein [Ruminococcus sp.]